MSGNVGTAQASSARLVPSEHLRSDEAIKVEEKPHILAFIKLSLLIWFVFWTIVMVVGLTMPLIGGVFFLLWLLLAFLPVLIRYRRWRITYYALSDQRIIIGGPGKTFLSKSLVDYNIQRQMGLTDVNMTRVTGVIMEQPLGGRIFNFGTVIFKTVPTGDIKWYGVKEPARIRKLIEDIVKSVQSGEYFQQKFTDQFANEAASQYAKLHQERAFEVAKAVAPPPSVPSNLSAPVTVGNPQMPTANINNYCRQCGNKIQDPTSQFCPKCGMKMT